MGFLSTGRRLSRLAVVPALLWALGATCLPADSTPETASPRANGAPSPYRLVSPPLDTPWTDKVGTSPWNHHPRPRLYREDWASLNGLWTFQPASSGDDSNSPPSGPLSQEVLVPSCVESGISGIMTTNVTWMWFARNFEVPSNWNPDNRVILIFEAVDYEATVYVNGQKAGFNRGGYFRFSLDITDLVKFGETNEIKVFVFDPTDLPGYHNPRGKQTLNPSHIWYTPCSGIWQSVWMESVPENHVTDLEIVADMHGEVSVLVHSSIKQSTPVEVTLWEGGSSSSSKRAVSQVENVANQKFSFTFESPKLWSPDTPHLYNITVKMGDDSVRSYTGFRTVESGVVKGIKRPLLNGKFVFQFGTLDQGYWPDGIYTPPTLEAMAFDLEVLKGLGMNMVRKHIKIEPDLFYELCDKIGLMVVQDMPSMSGGPAQEDQEEFERQIDLMVNQFKGYPSIVTWVIYNEGWGQITDPNVGYPEFRITERIRELDPTRLINAITGWHDHGAGDFHDNHHYADPQCGTPWYSILSTPYDAQRIGFQGEYGGLGHVPAKENLWPIQQAVDTINQTYEINVNLEAYHYRTHTLFNLLRDQVARYACSGAVYTQTSDVEGEVNGLVTYDRRVMRVDAEQWKKDIQALYDAAESRT